MLRLAFLGPRFDEQLKAAPPEALEGIDVVWVGTDRQGYAADAVPARPQVLVIDLALLDDEDPKADLERLSRAADAELTLVIYGFLRRRTISDLQDEKTRAIQGPVSITGLRSQMLSLIIREMFESKSASPEPAICPTCGRSLPAGTSDYSSARSV